MSVSNSPNRERPTGRIARLAWSLIVTLPLAACGAGGSPSVGGQPVPATGSGTLAHGSAAATAGGTVATFNGTGGAAQDTGSFTVHGGPVRFVYTVRHNSTGPVPLLWKLYEAGVKADPASPRASSSCTSCDGEQTDDLGVVPAGTYYVHIITSRPWKLTVIEK